MLKGISPVVDGALLAVLDHMGHGDEIVLADAHFPSFSSNTTVLKTAGVGVPALLDGILPIFELDTYVSDPLVMVKPVKGDVLEPTLLADCRAVIARNAPSAPSIVFIERFAFYDRARRAFAVVATGETRKYGNILLKKGVTPTWEPVGLKR